MRALVDQMGERVFPYLKLDKCWKPRIVAALRAQEPGDHDPGKEKRYKTALENLRKQHLWGDVSDEKYQIEKEGLERQLKLAAPPVPSDPVAQPRAGSRTPRGVTGFVAPRRGNR